MTMINIGAEDVLRSKIMKPEWYEAVVKECRVEENKAKDANNYVTEFLIAQEPYKGVPITVWFSEKAPGFMIPFIIALGGKIDEKGGQFDPSKFANKPIRVHVVNDNYMGRLTNKIDNYMPTKSAA